MIGKIVTGGVTVAVFFIFMRIASSLTSTMSVSPENSIIQMFVTFFVICPLSYATALKLIKVIKTTDF